MEFKGLCKMYTSNIFFRLQELSNPFQNDQIRWPMELSQNAKDTLFAPTNIDKKDKVAITLEVKRDISNEITEVIFSHNGSAFNEESLFAILYKMSSGKDENNQTTGQFGTGFVSTFVLSRIIYIKGDIYDEEKNSTTGFSIALCREGKTKKELYKNTLATRDNINKNLKPFNSTEFRYPIQSEKSRKCVENGIDHYKKHIPNVLINCPNIECIRLLDNNTDEKYSASMIEQVFESIYCYKVSCNNDSQYFLVVKDDTNNIDISIEIDLNKYEQNKIIEIVPNYNNKDSLFVTFPLIGSKAHNLPFFINSPNFIPTIERDGLYLEGDEYINSELTNVGKNRFLLMKSIALYEKLILFLIEKNCSNKYL